MESWIYFGSLAKLTWSPNSFLVCSWIGIMNTLGLLQSYHEARIPWTFQKSNLFLSIEPHIWSLFNLFNKLYTSTQIYTGHAEYFYVQCIPIFYPVSLQHCMYIQKNNWVKTYFIKPIVTEMFLHCSFMHEILTLYMHWPCPNMTIAVDETFTHCWLGNKWITG